jgi:hypothetical protein
MSASILVGIILSLRGAPFCNDGMYSHALSPLSSQMMPAPRAMETLGSASAVVAPPAKHVELARGAHSDCRHRRVRAAVRGEPHRCRTLQTLRGGPVAQPFEERRELGGCAWAVSRRHLTCLAP